MLCIIAKCSPEADEKLNAFRAAVLPQYSFASLLNAHITIATYLPEDDRAFMAACGKLISGTRPFSVRYEKLEVFSETSVIVAVPSVPAELTFLHNSIVKEFSSSLDRWTCGTAWYPHTTLLYNPAADLHQLCRAMQKCFVPFDARIDQIWFSRVEDSGYTIVKSVDLSELAAEWQVAYER